MVPLHRDYKCYYKIWLTCLFCHVYRKCPVVHIHLLLRWITDYPCMQVDFELKLMSIPQFWNVLFCQWCWRKYGGIGASACVHVQPVLISQAYRVWDYFVYKFQVVLHRGPGVYGDAWRARANVCSCDYKYAGWAQGDCFPSVPVCSYDVEWHLFLRSVPRLSRGERSTQVLEGEGHFSSPAPLSCLQLPAGGFSCCCSFPDHPGVIMGRPMFSNVMTKCLFTGDLI